MNLDVVSNPPFLVSERQSGVQKVVIMLKDIGLSFFVICFDLHHMVLLHLRKLRLTYLSGVREWHQKDATAHKALAH